jgi:hypothetical protein
MMYIPTNVWVPKDEGGQEELVKEFALLKDESALVEKITSLAKRSQWSRKEKENYGFIKDIVQKLTHSDPLHDWTAEDISSMFSILGYRFNVSKHKDDFDKIFDELPEPEQKTAFRELVLNKSAIKYIHDENILNKERGVERLIELASVGLDPKQAMALVIRKVPPGEVGKSKNPKKFADILNRNLEGLSKYTFFNRSNWDKIHSVANSQHEIEDIERAFNFAKLKKIKPEDFTGLCDELIELKPEQLKAFNEKMLNEKSITKKKMETAIKELKKK